MPQFQYDGRLELQAKSNMIVEIAITTPYGYKYIGCPDAWTDNVEIMVTNHFCNFRK